MPINFEDTGSVSEVMQEIRALESQYGMTTAEFLALDPVDERVAEADAVEWSFLLMQKDALECDALPCGGHVFFASCETETSAVDDYDVRELIAA